MRQNRWERAAASGGRRPAALENLAPVPASLLPHKAIYQRLANQLPAGAVLVVLPDEDTPERRSLQEAAARLRAKGHAIATVPAADILAQAQPRQPSKTAAPPTSPAPVIGLTAAPAPPPESSSPVQADEVSTDAAIPPFVHELRLVRIDAGEGPVRLEVWRWQPTLWGGVALIRLHGALGQPPRTQLVLEADAPQADAARARLHRRLQAGYRIVDWD